jgi:hypothetical protein
LAPPKSHSLSSNTSIVWLPRAGQAAVPAGVQVEPSVLDQMSFKNVPDW